MLHTPWSWRCTRICLDPSGSRQIRVILFQKGTCDIYVPKSVDFSVCSFIFVRPRALLVLLTQLITLSEVRNFQVALAVGTTFIPASAAECTPLLSGSISFVSDHLLSHFFPVYLQIYDPPLTDSNM